MLTIRLKRVGKKNSPAFRVILAEKSSSARTGKVIEYLGSYNPISKAKAFNKERILYWISKGAKPSPSFHNQLVSEKIIDDKKVKAWRPKKQESTATPTASVPVEEKTAEEVLVEEKTEEKAVETEQK